MTAGLHHRLAGGWVGNRQTEELVVPPLMRVAGTDAA